MRLGIDFGTTRIVVAAVDRGNYPLVSFESNGESFDWFPSLIAFRGSERRYGWAAWNVQTDPRWTVVRSLKRHLMDAGPHTRLDLGPESVSLLDTISGLTAALRDNLSVQYGAEKFEVMLGVPANANSNQRFLTVEAFRRSGFDVLGMLNEPSAGAIEYGHRHHLQKVQTRVLVYDLGGGTFDASLVEVGGAHDESGAKSTAKEPATSGVNTVLSTASISSLGGDDFDRVLATLAVGEDRLRALRPGALFRLEEECRRQKEALHANSRRIVIDLEGIDDKLGQSVVPVADYYEQCRPLLEETLAATTALATSSEIDVLYITGGGSELPLVARILREEYARKVKRSEYTRSATAIGLAIQAGATVPPTLREVFSRNFGVWREAEAGGTMVFDAIFAAGTRLSAPGAPPLKVTREYSPVHNIGHFRFLEATANPSNLNTSVGDMAEWDTVLFPFDPALARYPNLDQVPVQQADVARQQQIEEVYSCDAAGSVTVVIRNLTANYEQTYRLGRWKERAAVVTLTPKKRARGGSS